MSVCLFLRAGILPGILPGQGVGSSRFGNLLVLTFYSKMYLLIGGGTLPVREGVLWDRQKGKGAEARSALRGSCGLERTSLVFTLPVRDRRGGSTENYQSAGRMRILGRVLEAMFPS